MLLKSLHAFDKKRLKHTDTHVKTIEGKHFVEKRDPNGEVKTEMMEGTTYGYVVSYVYDLQVGEILPNLIIGKILEIQSKPSNEVTSIKQSPVLKGHLFLYCHRKFHMNCTSFKWSLV